MSSIEERNAVWMALSDLFVDNEVSYDHIAERVSHLTMSEVEHILFFEVAPVCMRNLLVLKPAICKGFSEEYVIPNIQHHLQRWQEEQLYQRTVRYKIKFYKVFMRHDWRKLATKIAQVQGVKNKNGKKPIL